MQISSENSVAAEVNITIATKRKERQNIDNRVYDNIVLLLCNKIMIESGWEHMRDVSI